MPAQKPAGLGLIILDVLIMALVSISCNEELPVYEAPAALFDGTLNALYLKKGGALTIHGYVWNTYRETLEGPARLTGTLEIILKRDQRYRKTVDLSPALFEGPPRFIDWTGRLTIDPGDSLEFVYQWYFVDDNGVNLPSSVFRIMSTGEPHALEETFIIRGYVSVFDKTGQLTFEEIQYPLTYYY